MQNIVLVRGAPFPQYDQRGFQYTLPMNGKRRERAMLATGGFERSDFWANIAGNFDGEGFTCGQRGKSVKAGGQYPLINRYRCAHGDAQLHPLMPKTRREYFSAINSLVSVDMASGSKKRFCSLPPPFRFQETSLLMILLMSF